MFKNFGSTKEVFVNQDEGMFVALPITLDDTVLTLEKETRNGRTYVKAGSVVKEGTVVKGILAEEYDITYGPVGGRVVLEGYAWAENLTTAAMAAISSLPKIVTIPHKEVYVALVGTSGLKATLNARGAYWASTVAKTDFTFNASDLTISTVAIDANGDLEITFSAAGTDKITAIAGTAFVGATGSVLKGLPIDITVASA